MRHSAFSALVVCASIALVGFGSARQEAVATRTSQPPVIDGDLSDPVWSRAIPFADFTQQVPDEGQPPSQRTEVRILYDDRAIYFGIRCFDSDPPTIVANLTRRDRDTFSDTIWLDIDTRGDHRSAFHFEVNAAGVQRDGIRTGDRPDLGAIDWEWDAIWQSAVQRDSQGWTAELAIPLSELRYESGHPVTWRMEIRRFIGRRSETDQWIFIPLLEFSEMFKYGPLVGFSELPSLHALRLTPFVAERVRSRRSPPELMLPRGIDSTTIAGLDISYGITSNLALQATLLPDFGQVEADEVKLNLTTYELRYPEKRPFFLEGANLFLLINQFGLPVENAQLFYSRRVGAATPDPYLPTGTSLVDAPGASGARIWGAAKLVGRIGPKLDLALLEAVTAAESATIASADGTRTQERVAPLTNFFIARLATALSKGVTSGLLFTSVLRKERSGSLGIDGLCPNQKAPSADGRCTHDATTAALDLKYTSSDGGYLGYTTVFGSLISGGPPRTLRDGTLIKAGDAGLGWLVQAAKARGRLFGRFAYEAETPRLDLNDAGFLGTQNDHRILLEVGWREFNWGATRQANIVLDLTGKNSWDGVRTARLIDLNSTIYWNNVWTTGLHLERVPTVFDNRETRDGARTERAAQWGVAWNFNTDQTRSFYVQMQGSAFTTWRGYSLSASGSVVFRPSGRFELSLAPTLNRVTGDPRFLEIPTLADGSKPYRFGLQNALAPGATLRTILTFTPTMTLQTYTQLFIASVRYDQLFDVSMRGPKSNIYLGDLTPVAADPSHYNTSDPALNLQVLFRWEYLPGSVLYLVYTRSQVGRPLLNAEGQPVAPPVLDFAALRRGPIEDVFLVKISFSWAH